jgi:hypothetical protein
VWLGSRRRSPLGDDSSTTDRGSPLIDEEFHEREREASRLLASDIEYQLDIAEEDLALSEKGIEAAEYPGALNWPVQKIAKAMMRSEVAWSAKCEGSNKTPQCWRSGELINRGQDDLEHAMRRAYHIGVKEGYQAQLEKEQEQRKLKKKRGWFW